MKISFLFRLINRILKIEYLHLNFHVYEILNVFKVHCLIIFKYNFFNHPKFKNKKKKSKKKK